MSTSSANMLLLGGMAIVAVLIAWASYAGKWSKVTRRTMIFCFPPVMKVVLCVCGVWIFAFLPDLYAYSHRAGASWGLDVFVGLLIVGFGMLMFWIAGARRELYLDLERRRYRLIWGWLFWTQGQSGEWSDFRGIFVRIVNRQHGQLFFVGLAGNCKQSHLPYLGQFEDWNRASAFASEMSKVLGISIVAPPQTEQLRPLYR
jgi:hypothetical protein